MDKLGRRRIIPCSKLRSWQKYENEYGMQEARYPGFLTGNHHAMYIENETEYERLLFVNVSPTDDPDVYLDISPGYCVLGYLHESYDPISVIKELNSKLHSMTAYEFLMKVIIHVQYEIEFEDWIIPRLLEGNPRG